MYQRNFNQNFQLNKLKLKLNAKELITIQLNRQVLLFMTREKIGSEKFK